jgi:hypothetical protein
MARCVCHHGVLAWWLYLYTVMHTLLTLRVPAFDLFRPLLPHTSFVIE